MTHFKDRFISFLKARWKILLILSLLIIFYYLIPVPDAGFDSDHSVVVTDRNGELLRAFLNGEEQWHFPPDPDAVIPEKLTAAAVNFEDRYFFYHPGINPVSIVRAALANLFSGKIRSGASTLSMQVIRLAFRKKRNLFNKFIEMLQAVKLEIRYSKNEILRMYFNNAPYGGNIIGITAASLRYFGKYPSSLTWNEAAILAVLPNSPGLISPLINRAGLIKKKNGLLEKLMKRGVISRDIYRQSIQENVPEGVIPVPVSAPHFSEWIRNEYPGSRRMFMTTIDKTLQSGTENLLREHMKYLHSVGIRNGAVVVAETESGKVRAYCGSQDFFDEERNGQVDGARASRSSGSILKPFLYALAIDEGAILERTLMKDIPSYFGSFSPSNASRVFSGVVTAKEALIRSLNVPAVRLLNFYGLHKFYLFLKSSGLTSLVRDPDDYGLTLILGGAETRLIDLVRLYRGLGTRGRFSSLSFLEGGPPGSGRVDLISPESCYLTLNMLRELRRPGAEYYWDLYQNRKPIAWKTGTSYGQRDAWAVGVSPEWTIGVWAGNFSGEGNPELGGHSSAAPLMFDVFNSLPQRAPGEWFSRKGLRFNQIELCSRTGFLAGEHCGETIMADSPAGSEAVRPCPYHRQIFVSEDETFSVCSLCWEEGKYKSVKKLVYPPDVSQFLREKGDIVDKVPPHTPGCVSGNDGSPIQILYPVKGAKILIPVDFSRKVQNMTMRVAHKFSDREIFWYIDKVYKGVTRGTHKMMAELAPGWHSLEVIDTQGNTAKQNFFISFTGKNR